MNKLTGAMALGGLMVAATCLLATDARAAGPATIKYDRIAFELPAGEWQRSTGGSRLDLRRTLGAQRFQTLSVWQVEVPPDIRSFSVRQHVTAYFDGERRAQRDPALRWQDFSETTLVAGPNEYYAMKFRVTWADPGVVLAQDGQFVLVFPSDFAKRQVFYCFMWMDLRPAGDAPTAGDIAPLVQALAAVSPAPQPPVDLRLARYMALEPPGPDAGAGAPLEGKAVATQALKTAQSLDQYASLIRMSVPGESPQFELRTDAAPGGRFHVLQSSGNEYDEWITVGKDHFRNAGMWFRPPPEFAEQDAHFNRFSSADKFLRLMAGAEPAASGVFAPGTGRYGVLEYRAPLGADFVPPLRLAADDPAQFRVWIDLQTGLLVKAEVMVQDSASGQLRRIEQSFAGQQVPVRIEPPTHVVNNGSTLR